MWKVNQQICELLYTDCAPRRMLHMMQLVPGVELSAGKACNHTTITLTFPAAFALYVLYRHL